MSKLTKIMVALMVTTLALTSCEVNLNKNFHSNKEKGEETIRNFKNFKPFERITIDAVCNISFVQGDTLSITATGEKSNIDALIIKSENGELNINCKSMKKLTRLSDAQNVDIEISAPDLIGVELRGAGRFTADEPIDTDTLLLQIKGAGVIEVNEIICDKLVADLRGAGTMNLGPITSQETQLRLKGVGMLDADFTSGGDVLAQLTGVGTINVNGRVKSIQKTVLGTGSINSNDVEIK